MSLVLVGMSAVEAGRRAELLALARRSGATIAFLQQGEPSLTAELARLADARTTEEGTGTGGAPVVLVGVRLGGGGPGPSWLRRVAAYWWREHGGPRPEVRVGAKLAGDLAEVAAAAATARPVTGAEPGLTSAAWAEVPGHRHQVLVCRGPRCTAKGADATLRALVGGLGAHGLGDDDVLVTQTGCQFPCNQAPVVSVQPDDVWYGRVDPAAAAAIVAAHLAGGRPEAEHRLPRHRAGPPSHPPDFAGC
ncbi:(2Fe-2S) ferredoxin domain-containing protein [Actinacidiphila sp. bgisy144]|uniref:(2Fe-2S) ferredoxin domain-containing protein n=1 Tax=Actinacidiphila sp. bgisy144 TaxID=3413791 RepID=UPI003EBB835B